MLLDFLNRTDDALVSDRSYKIENQAPPKLRSQGARGRQRSYKRPEFAGIRGKLTRRRECECDEGHTDSIELGGVVRLMEPQV